MHFTSSCELLVARYLFWACFALLHSFCFGAVEGLVTKYCDCRKGSSGVWSVVFLSSTCRSHLDVFRASSPFVFPCAVFHFFVGVLWNPVCDFHTLLLHACLAPLSFIHVLCTFSRCWKGFVFKDREYLHQMVGEQNCPIRVVIIHLLVVLAPGLLCVILSGYF